MPERKTQEVSPIATPETLGARIFRARVELTISGGRKVTQASLGAMVSKHLGRRVPPVTGATVSRWESGDTVPDVQTVEAIAAACQVDPGWLAFGTKSGAPSPWSEPRGLRGLTRRMVFKTVEQWLSENRASAEASRAVRHLPWLTRELERITDIPDKERAHKALLKLDGEWRDLIIRK